MARAWSEWTSQLRIVSGPGAGPGGDYLASHLQVGLPGRVELADRDHQEEVVFGGTGLAPQLHPHLVGEAVLLLGVAPPATSDHVLPSVGAALGLRLDVVDVLGFGTAVLTLVIVAKEDRSSRERGPGSERDIDEVIEANHGGDGNVYLLGVERTRVSFDDRGFGFEHEDDCPPGWNDTQRLE